MTVEQALEAMAAIDGQNDGSEARAVLVESMYRHLLESPEDFWEHWFAVFNPAEQNHYRQLAERMLQSGDVTETTTIADVKTVLETHNAVRP